MREENNKLFSVIVPAYKQEKTIIEDLLGIEEILKKIRYDHELICVVDGQIDKTYQKAKKLESKNIKVVGYKENRGKGYAVRYGMAKSKGDFVAFIDSGMDIDPKGIPLLLEHMLWYDSDVIVGSLRHSASKVRGYPLKRKIYSIGYHLFTKLIFGLKITDSQRGLKIFKRQVLEKVLPRLLIKKFAFDIEMLAVAKHLGFEKIHDGPVEMDAAKMKHTSIKFITVWSMFIDTLAIFYRLYVLKYYDSRNYHCWQKDPELTFDFGIDK